MYNSFRYSKVQVLEKYIYHSDTKEIIFEYLLYALCLIAVTISHDLLLLLLYFEFAYIIRALEKFIELFILRLITLVLRQCVKIINYSICRLKIFRQ